ncbi:hypothetical protein [Cupriavidus sp. DL-D2]|uniref:hypothetical protein n=1 Tax=Cupriavidus sp. DL-D2 TaxID=3144974 RepID=UPI0032120BB7
MEAQVLFNTVAKHLMVQGRRAMANQGQTCAYRSADGCKCAVGVLIPDELYDVHMEGLSIARMLDQLDELELPAPLAQFIKNDLEPHLHLLMALQAAHDGLTPEDWAGELRRIARKFKLNLPEVLQ